MKVEDSDMATFLKARRTQQEEEQRLKKEKDEEEGRRLRELNDEHRRHDAQWGVPKISPGDLDMEPEPIASGSFKDVIRAQLRHEMHAVGKQAMTVAVIRLRQWSSTLVAVCLRNWEDTPILRGCWLSCAVARV